MARVTDVALDKHTKLIRQWNNDPEFDFDNRCVFIDEPGFNLHIRRNFGRSKRRRPARAVIPSQRGVSITILGVICELGIINVLLRNHNLYKVVKGESKMTVALCWIQALKRVQNILSSVSTRLCILLMRII